MKYLLEDSIEDVAEESADEEWITPDAHDRFEEIKNSEWALQSWRSECQKLRALKDSKSGAGDVLEECSPYLLKAYSFLPFIDERHYPTASQKTAELCNLTASIFAIKANLTEPVEDSEASRRFFLAKKKLASGSTFFCACCRQRRSAEDVAQPRK